MMSYIRSRSGITGSTHLLYNIGFTFAGNQENDTLRVIIGHPVIAIRFCPLFGL